MADGERRHGRRRGQPRSWSVWIAPLVGLVAVLPLLAGCGSPQTGSVKAQTSCAVASPDTVSEPVLPRPAQLAPYHVYVTDLVTGNVAELGVRTTHVSRSVHGLGLSPDGRTLFVTDVSGTCVDGFALDGGILGTEREAPVGELPVHMVATLDGKTLFVTNFAARTVSVVNMMTWQPVKTITVPAQPHGIVLSPDGRWAYVSCYGGAAIAVIDTASAALAATVSLPAGAQPYGIQISADGRYVYASDNFTGRLFVIDTMQRRLLDSLEVGLHPALIARSPDGKTLYVANGGSHSVSVIDLAGNPAHPRVRATIVDGIEGYPHGIAVTPDGRYVVVANTQGQNLSVIDTSDNQVIDTIASPAVKFPNDVLITG